MRLQPKPNYTTAPGCMVRGGGEVLLGARGLSFPSPGRKPEQPKRHQPLCWPTAEEREGAWPLRAGAGPRAGCWIGPPLPKRSCIEDGLKLSWKWGSAEAEIGVPTLMLSYLFMQYRFVMAQAPWTPGARDLAP